MLYSDAASDIALKSPQVGQRITVASSTGIGLLSRPPGYVKGSPSVQAGQSSNVGLP
jgi:hypothetical protein